MRGVVRGFLPRSVIHHLEGRFYCLLFIYFSFILLCDGNWLIFGSTGVFLIFDFATWDKNMSNVCYVPLYGLQNLTLSFSFIFSIFNI